MLDRSLQLLARFAAAKYQIHDPPHQYMLQQPQAMKSELTSNSHLPGEEQNIRIF